jgi:uncharacterized membrane protein YgdD (TMEM256/DUF423 family)
MRIEPALAALFGLLAVGFGAFAAHGASDSQAVEWLTTGAHYQATHALAVFACLAVGGRKARLAAWLFLAGGAIFGSTLYAMAFGAPRILGAVTPVGGLLLMGGWAVLAYAALGERRSAKP